MDMCSGCCRSCRLTVLATAVGMILWSTCVWAASPRDSFLVTEVTDKGPQPNRGRGVTVFHDKEFAYIVSGLYRKQDGKIDTLSYQVHKVGSDRKVKAQRFANSMFLRIAVGEAPPPLPNSRDAVKVGDKVQIMRLDFNLGKDKEIVPTHSEMEAVVKGIYYDLQGKLQNIAVEGKGIAGRYPAVVVSGDGVVVGMVGNWAVRSQYSLGRRSRSRDPWAVAIRYVMPVKSLMARIQAEHDRIKAGSVEKK